MTIAAFLCFWKYVHYRVFPIGQKGNCNNTGEHNSHFTFIYTLMQDVAWQGDEDISKMEFGTFSSLLSVNGRTKEIHVW